ncbi:MAG: P-loop NTPase fold protein [bacterium]|nr:P-loop NTPase fold protein [bacterium]
MKAIDELNIYINAPEISGALLLTGKWGCGKTYLVNQFKEKADQNEFAIVVLSLFGIDSISMLTSKIREQVALATFPSVQKLETKAPEGKKIISVVWEGLKQQAKVAEHLSSVTAFIPIEKEIGIGEKKRKLVLIFDDFERSDISKKELLGAINDYVESKRIKTILIAAEDKIQDEDYDEFKEKVISRTIKLSPDYSSIIHEIIDDFSETAAEYKEFLLKEEQHIIQLFTESKSGNLRTLRSLLIDFERVFSCLKKICFDEIKASNIFCSFGAMLFEHKAGNYKSGQYGYLTADAELQKKYSFNITRCRLVTLQKWVTEGVWDEEATCDEYRQRFCQEELSSEDKFIHWSFWDLSDTIVSEGFPPSIQKAYNGELPGKLLMNLIKKIALARKWNISLPQEIDYDKIEEGLQLRIRRIKNNEIVEPEYHTFVTDEERNVLSEREKQLYTIASDLGGDLLSYWQNRRSFIDNMANGDEIAIRQLKNCYYISFDQEMMGSLFARYLTADVDIKRAIAHVISEIHFKDFMKPQEPESTLSINCLKELMRKVEDHCSQEKDSFARIHDQYFITVVSKRIVDLEEELREQQEKDAQEAD